MRPAVNVSSLVQEPQFAAQHLSLWLQPSVADRYPEAKSKQGLQEGRIACSSDQDMSTAWLCHDAHDKYITSRHAALHEEQSEGDRPSPSKCRSCVNEACIGIIAYHAHFLTYPVLQNVPGSGSLSCKGHDNASWQAC